MRPLMATTPGHHDVLARRPGRRGRDRLSPSRRAARVPGLRAERARAPARARRRAVDAREDAADGRPPRVRARRAARRARAPDAQTSTGARSARSRARPAARDALAVAVAQRDRDVDRARSRSRCSAASPTRSRTRRSCARRSRSRRAARSCARQAGIEAIPLGTFFVEIHPALFIPAGYDVTPAVAPEVLYRALGAPARRCSSSTPDARAIAVAEERVRPARDGAARGASRGSRSSPRRSSARSTRSRVDLRSSRSAFFRWARRSRPRRRRREPREGGLRAALHVRRDQRAITAKREAEARLDALEPLKDLLERLRRIEFVHSALARFPVQKARRLEPEAPAMLGLAPGHVVGRALDAAGARKRIAKHHPPPRDRDPQPELRLAAAPHALRDLARRGEADLDSPVVRPRRDVEPACAHPSQRLLLAHALTIARNSMEQARDAFERVEDAGAVRSSSITGRAARRGTSTSFSGDAALALSSPRSVDESQRLLLLEPQDALLDAAGGEQDVDEDRLRLADAVRAIGRLRLRGRVPPRIVVDDGVGARRG